MKIKFAKSYQAASTGLYSQHQSSLASDEECNANKCFYIEYMGREVVVEERV